MCGIYCAVSCETHILPDAALERRLRARGPDSWCPSKETWAADVASRQVYICFCCSVLSLRGSETTAQPFRDSKKQGYTLCWNGEAWSIGNRPITSNDTAAVHELLTNALITHGDDDREPQAADPTAQVAAALSTVTGPYAFVLFDRRRGNLFFGRDFLGRRSLLWRRSLESDFVLSSVPDSAPDNAWCELEAGGVYCVNLNSTSTSTGSKVPGVAVPNFVAATFVPYPSADGEKTNSFTSVIPQFSLSTMITKPATRLDDHSRSVHELDVVLREALSRRILDIPDPPAASGLPVKPSRLAVLFSGGLDCTMLARVAHELLPMTEPVDLLNVAFENPRIRKAGTEPDILSVFEACPDRITGRKSYTELMNICPQRVWRFVAINVAYQELLQNRNEIISLMSPHNTEMDLSIASALFFAARGTGKIAHTAEDDTRPYISAARVLLSGLGADELFAGYTRHATAFRQRGHTGLLEELQLDVARLGKRNLGRDDRVLSNWGRETRFPYLDEQLLAWAMALPVDEKSGFGEPELDHDVDGAAALEPGKKVLRCLAFKLGMKGVAAEKKRAVLLPKFFVRSHFTKEHHHRSSLEPAQPRWRPARRKAQR